MVRNLTVLFVVLLAISVESSASEEWHCWKNFFKPGQPIVKLTQGDDKKTGSVEVFGEAHSARVGIAGLTKRWGFGENLEYAVEIEPDGLAYYLDFSEEDKVKPSMTFYCELTQSSIGDNQRLYEEAELPQEESLSRLNSIRDAYILAIRQKVERNWRKPAGSGKMPVCEVRVLQGPGGIVLDVTFGTCDGSTALYRASIEKAIYSAEPLPTPGDDALFERELKFLFNPEESSTTTFQKSSKRKRSANEIERVFLQNKGSIFNLYNRALRKNPSLAGQVVIELTISPEGRVTAAKVLSSELGDETLEQKLIKKVKKLRFPKADVREITVTYPIDFLPS